MSARQQTLSLIAAVQRRTGVMLSFDDANTLRRAELTLQRWAALECGDGNDYASWSIERDEQTGLPYRVTYLNQGNYGYSVWCLSDIDADGNAEVVRVTRRTFQTQDKAQEYAATVAKSRQAQVRPVLSRRERIADREAGALRRVKAVCERNGLHYYHQTDPRGCSLYVASEPLTDSAYSYGVACCG